MGLISWLVIGGLAGWVASMIMKTDASMGIVANIIVGLIGALIGGLIMSLIGKTGVTDFNLYSFLVAVLGAIVLLALIRMVRRR